MEEFTINFIKDYERLECLWNPKIRAYSDKKMRADALRELENKYNLDTKQVKDKIKNIRSYFVKEYEKTKRSYRDYDETYVSSWYAYKYMLFLKNDTEGSKGRHPNSNLERTSNESEHHSQKNEREKISAESMGSKAKENENITSVPVAQNTSASNYESSAYKNVGVEKKRSLLEADCSLNKKGAYEIIKKTISTIIDDEYTAFGNLVGHKVRKLKTEKLRNLAEYHINNILLELATSKENEFTFGKQLMASDDEEENHNVVGDVTVRL